MESHSASDKRVLPWFPGLQFHTGTSLAHAQAEFCPSHPVLPRLHIFCVDVRVHAIIVVTLATHTYNPYMVRLFTQMNPNELQMNPIN